LVLTVVVFLPAFSHAQLTYQTTSTYFGGCDSTWGPPNKITYSDWVYEDSSGVSHYFGGSDYLEVRESKFIVGPSGEAYKAYCGASVITSLDGVSTDYEYYLQATGGSGTVTAVGYLNPKYLIMGVTYAPPGGNTGSSVSYADTNFVGNTSTIGSSFSQNYTYSVSVCGGSCGGGGGIPGVQAGGSVTGTTSQSWTQSSNSSNTITLSKQQTLTQLTPGTPNVYSPFNHDYDIVWVWLNPVVFFSMPITNTQTSGSITWNGYGYDFTDPLHEIDLWPIYVGYLNGDFKKSNGTPCYAIDPTCDPQDADALSRGWVTTQTFASGQTAAITAADLTNICAADPFCPNPGYVVSLESGVTPPTTTDQRYTLSEFENETPQSIAYKQAAPDSTKGETEIYNDQYSTTTSASQGGSYSYQLGFGMEEKFGGSFFGIGVQYDMKQGWSFTWTDTWQNTVTNTSTQTDIATITGPPCPAAVAPCVPVYTEPHEFAVYQDDLYGTFMFWPNPYFSISATPATQTVKAGGATTFQIPTAANAGYTGSISSFNVTGLPSGVSYGFSPSSGTPGFTSTLTLSTATTTAAGTYPLTISATDGSLTYYACASACLSASQPYATLVVTAQPSFSIAATPTSQTIGIGANTTYTVTTTALNGFSGVVDLNVDGVPSNSSWSFSPEAVTGSGSSSLTITTTGNTLPGTYPLTITGTSGSLTETTTATLIVTGANFILSATPEGQSINAGGSATYTVSTTVVSGFNGVVGLTLGPTPLPSGVSYTFSPTSITGAGSSTLTITTTTSTPAGEYNFIITGTSGSLEQTSGVTLEVNN
jgi:hypothetical protein